MGIDLRRSCLTGLAGIGTRFRGLYGKMARFVFDGINRFAEPRIEGRMSIFRELYGGVRRAHFGHYLLAVSVPANEPPAVFYGRVRVVWGVDRPDAFLNCRTHELLVGESARTRMGRM